MVFQQDEHHHRILKLLITYLRTILHAVISIQQVPNVEHKNCISTTTVIKANKSVPNSFYRMVKNYELGIPKPQIEKLAPMVWKLKNSSVTQILSEIKVLPLQNVQINQIQNPLNGKNGSFTVTEKVPKFLHRAISINCKFLNFLLCFVSPFLTKLGTLIPNYH